MTIIAQRALLAACEKYAGRTVHRGALTVPSISILQHSELRARPHMHMNIVNNSFDIVLTPSLRQVNRKHSESDQYGFLLFIP